MQGVPSFATFTFNSTGKTMAKKKKKKKQQGSPYNLFPEHSPYEFAYEPDDCDCMPAMIAEKKSFKKLDRDEKAVIKDFIVDAVTTYWHEKRQIPVGESLAAIRKTLAQLYLEEYRVILKDDTELKNYLRDNALSTINKLLKAEKQEERK